MLMNYFFMSCFFICDQLSWTNKFSSCFMFDNMFGD